MPQKRARLAVPVVAAEALLALSHVTSSFRLPAGRSFRTTIQYGTLGSRATGSRSLSMSNGSV